MGKIRKLKAVRTIVRLDRREAYLEAWKAYEGAVRELGAQAWLFEDESLPGRFMEFTEFEGAAGMEGRLERALREAGVRERSLRREGDDLLYRERTG